ncbi:MAG: hypothetical protein JW708_08870, partial [Vallitaleaceae bacterium]|nr:hypothetical protein [Vallitaleaceae bacterium]
MNQFFIAYTQVIREENCFFWNAKVTSQEDLFFSQELEVTFDEGQEWRARGQVKIHYYDHGFIVLHYGFHVETELMLSIEMREMCLKETKPWLTTHKWKWSTPFGERSLYQVHYEILKNKALVKEEQPWYTLVAREVPGFFSKHLIDEEECNYYYVEEEGHLLLDRSNCCCYYQHDCTRGEEFAWAILNLLEIALIRMKRYDEYDLILTKEMERVKAKELSPAHLSELAIFHLDFPSYLLKLDKTVQAYSDPMIRLYEEISKLLGFDEKRIDLRGLLQEWSVELRRRSIELPKQLKKFVVFMPQYKSKT